MSVASFLTQLQSLLPRGSAWSRAPLASITKVLESFAPEFNRVQQRADQLALEINPVTAVEMLDEHEFINGLPDLCAPIPTTVSARQAALASKLLENRGHNRADYIAIAEDLGHTGTTVHRRHVLPFRAGASRAGEHVRQRGSVFLYAVAYMASADTASPNDFTVWTPFHATVTANAGVAPDGTTTADRINFGTTDPNILRTWTTSPLSVQFDVYLRAESGDVPVAIQIRTVGGVVFAGTGVLVTSRWQRFTIRASHASGVVSVSIGRIGTYPASTILLWGARVGVVDTVAECKLKGARQAHTRADFRVIGDYLPASGFSGDAVVDELGNVVIDELGNIVTPD